MSAAKDSNTELIYVPLLDEGTTVSRPTQGVALGDRTYRLLATPEYDSADEHWAFPPGSVVHCRLETHEQARVLVARQLVEARHSTSAG